MRIRARELGDDFLYSLLNDVWDRDANAIRTTGGGGGPTDAGCTRVEFQQADSGNPTTIGLEDLLEVRGGTGTTAAVTLLVNRGGAPVPVGTLTTWAAMVERINAVSDDAWAIWYEVVSDEGNLRYTRVSGIERVLQVGDVASGTTIVWTTWSPAQGSPCTQSYLGVDATLRHACDQAAARRAARRTTRRNERMDEHANTPPAHGKGLLIAYTPAEITQIQQLWNPPRVTIVLATGDTFTIPGEKVVEAQYLDVVAAMGKPS